MSLDFTDFLEAVKREDVRRDLFICENTAKVRYEMQRLMDEAFAMNLNPMMRGMQNVIAFGISFGMFKVAHPFLDAALRGIQFTAIQGLDQLDKYDDMDSVKKNLEAQVR